MGNEKPTPGEGSMGIGSEAMPLSSGKKRIEVSRNQENFQKETLDFAELSPWFGSWAARVMDMRLTIQMERKILLIL